MKRTIEVDSEREYALNGYFKTEDGDLWLVSDVAPGYKPFDAELTCIWIGQPASQRQGVTPE